MFLSLSVFSASPTTPILPSDNIQDPGDIATPWGGCGPTDANCYIQLTSFTNENVIGLDYSTTTGLLSLTSGYGIPTTASTTAWNDAITSNLFSTSTTRNVLYATGPLVYSTSTGIFSINQASSTVSGYLSFDDFNIFSSKENAIIASSTSTYMRGDKTFQTLDTSAVMENGNLYFTNDRVNSILSATTSLPNLTTLSGLISATNLGSLGTITTGVWNGSVIGDAYLTKTGDWTGLFDGQEGSYYLNRENQTGTQLASTISDFSTTSRSLISTTATGLTYSTTTGLLSLTSGYEIPLVASTTEWNNKVSSQWVTNGANVYYTSGSVGVGTSSPVAKLSVKGSGTGTGLLAQFTDSANVARFTVLDNGNVGIGTTAPDAILHIEGAISASNNLFKMTDSTAAGGYFKITDGTSIASHFSPTLWAKGIGAGVNDRIGLSIISEPGEDTSTAAAISLQGRLNGAALTNASVLRINNYTSELFRISANGNVGIGTTTPAAKFSITAGGTGYGNALLLSNSSNVPSFAIQDNGNVGIGGYFPSGHTVTSGYRSLWMDSSNSGLIGETSSGFKGLNTVSNVVRSGLGWAQQDTARNSFIMSLGYEASNNGLTLYRAAAGSGNTFSTLFSVNENRGYFSGNIGIGTTTPADKLQVFGDIRIGTTGSNGCIKDYAGTGITGTCSSDERLKTNVVDLSDGYLEKLVNLKVITYNWNEEANTLNKVDTTVTNYGLLAQNVEAIFPELVTTDSNGYKQVNYSRIPLYLLKAVQELSKKVAEFANFIKTNKIETKELCIEDVCVTKQQLQQILQGQNITSSPSTNTTDTTTTTTDNTSTSTSSGDTTSEETTTTDNTSTSTPTEEVIDPVVVPEPEVVPEVIPEPTPTPEPVSEPAPVSEPVI